MKCLSVSEANIITISNGNQSENNQATTNTGAHWITGAFILFNTTIGTGFLIFPLTIDHLGGFFNANIAHLMILVFVMPTMYTLVYCSERYSLNTYHELVAYLCGKWAEKLVALTLVVVCYGISITLLILIGDQFDRIFLTFFGQEFCRHWYMNRMFTITLVTVLFIWPMTYWRQIYLLKYFMNIGIDLADFFFKQILGLIEDFLFKALWL